jgi:hypothetical protein
VSGRLPEMDDLMNQATVRLTILYCLVAATTNYVAAANKYSIRQDPQAVAIVQAAITAMGGDQAVASYQDSEATGTVTLPSDDSPASYPITIKSKGLRRTRDINVVG